MKYSDLRQNRLTGRKTAKNKSPEPDAPPKADAGPRPLSARQRAHLEGASAASGIRPAPMTTPVIATEPDTGRRRVVGGRGHKHRRVQPTAARVAALRRNRRRKNIPRALLLFASGVLVVECAAALLLSPRLWIRQVTVEGNTTVPTARLLSRLNVRPQTNLIRLPVGRLRAAALAEPAVEVAEIRRGLTPPTVTLIVRERQPWASVRVGEDTCYTIDRHLVAFRKGALPEPGLPVIELTARTEMLPVTLGKQMIAPGLSDTHKCLLWAAARPDFPLAKVSIDPAGKLCLNRIGGVRVLLGSGMDLAEKLNTLERLLERRPDLREGDATQVASVNLFAYDAPAILPRSEADKQAQEAAVPDPSASSSSLAAPVSR